MTDPTTGWRKTMMTMKGLWNCGAEVDGGQQSRLQHSTADDEPKHNNRHARLKTRLQAAKGVWDVFYK